MTEVVTLAAFVARARYEANSERTRQQLKIRVLDSLGCAIEALDGERIGPLRAQLADFGGNPLCILIGDGDKMAADRAAFYRSSNSNAFDRASGGEELLGACDDLQGCLM